MRSGNEISICFVGWNAFQFQHFLPLLRALPNSCFVLEVRNDERSQLSRTFLEQSQVNFIEVFTKDILEIDGQYDVVVCQTYFRSLEKFTRSKIAMLQYGYAKAAHNYAPWRSLADLVLTYGGHASRAIEPFAPTRAIGVPKYDQWLDPDWQRQARTKLSVRLDPAKSTILYAPTWGELSSGDAYLGAVTSLCEQFNVVIKAHHLLPIPVMDSRVLMLGVGDDLYEGLAVADVFISDYSGAIFDALLCRKPIALLELQTTELKGDKSDKFSLEIGRRTEIGHAVSVPADLPAVIGNLLSHGGPENDILRNELFILAQGAVSRALVALTELASGDPVFTQQQSYVRAEVRARLSFQEKVRTERTKLRKAKEANALLQQEIRSLKQNSIKLPRLLKWLKLQGSP